MARRHHEKERKSAERFDGAFRCTLCPDHFPRPDNDWCSVAGGVVCEECCRGLMMGDERLLAEASHRRGEEIDPEDTIAHCMECERLIRIVSEHLLDGEIDGVRLRMH